MRYGMGSRRSAPGRGNGYGRRGVSRYGQKYGAKRPGGRQAYRSKRAGYGPRRRGGGGYGASGPLRIGHRM